MVIQRQESRAVVKQQSGPSAAQLWGNMQQESVQNTRSEKAAALFSVAVCPFIYILNLTSL